MANDDKVEQATDELVEFAGAISAQDLTGYATKGDIRELELKMSIFRKDIILWLGGIMIIGFGSVVGMLVKYLPVVAKLVDAVGK